MAYDESLAARIEALVRGWSGIAPKQMFGGIGWLLHGNMCVGIWKESLIVRCDPADWAGLLREKHVREFDITGRSMKGWLMVDPPALATDASLRDWLEIGRRFAGTLPKKPAPAAKPKSPQPRARKSPEKQSRPLLRISRSPLAKRRSRQ